MFLVLRHETPDIEGDWDWLFFRWVEDVEELQGEPEGEYAIYKPSNTKAEEGCPTRYELQEMAELVRDPIPEPKLIRKEPNGNTTKDKNP